MYVYHTNLIKMFPLNLLVHFLLLPKLSYVRLGYVWLN